MPSQGMMRILHVAICLGAVSCIIEFIVKIVKVRLASFSWRGVSSVLCNEVCCSTCLDKRTPRRVTSQTLWTEMASWCTRLYSSGTSYSSRHSTAYVLGAVLVTVL